jgi:hypothetical protein
MSGKTIFEGKTPATQRADAVKSLITYIHNGQEPAEMPPFFKMSGELVLVKSNKGDCYYTTTPKTCSCPANTYHPGQACKHRRQYFPQPQLAKPSREESAGSIRPAGKWPGGYNGPVNMPDAKVVA